MILAYPDPIVQGSDSLSKRLCDHLKYKLWLESLAAIQCIILPHTFVSLSLPSEDARISQQPAFLALQLGQRTKSLHSLLCIVSLSACPPTGSVPITTPPSSHRWRILTLLTLLLWGVSACHISCRLFKSLFTMFAEVILAQKAKT